MILGGNGGGTKAMFATSLFGAVGVLAESHGNMVISYLFFSAVILSFTLSMAMLIRFAINFRRNGSELSACTRN